MEKQFGKVVFAVVDNAKTFDLSLAFPYSFHVDGMEEKIILELKKKDTNVAVRQFPYGQYTVRAMVHKVLDKKAMIPSPVVSKKVKFEVKEGYTTRITAYRPEGNPMIGLVAKVKLDILMIPEEI